MKNRWTAFPLHQAEASEWLLTNQTGSYAMGGIDRVPSRRYHGLWVQALTPPRQRRVLLHSLALDLTISGHTYPLWRAQWASGDWGPGPTGLFSFTLNHGIPSFHWDLALGALTETLWVSPGQPGIVVHYFWEGPPAQLRVTPLIAGRDHHQLQFEEPDAVYPSSDRVAIKWQDRVWMAHMAGVPFHANPTIFHGFFYADEARRGYGATEDLLSPGTFDAQLTTHHSLWFTFMEVQAGEVPALDPRIWARRERRRRHLLTNTALQAETFVAQTPQGGTSIIAGFPWFADWGRDALIALPGLAHQLNRPQLIEAVLDTFIENGVPIYTRWDETASAPHRTSADTNLWFIIRAAQALLSGQLSQPAQYLEVIDGIIHAYLTGRLPGIRLADDFLLTGHLPDHALTWMDAQLGNEVITPRANKPIEVQALWFNALMFRDQVAQRLGQSPQYGSLCRSIARTINRQYPAEYGFKDTLDPDDIALRPNQLYAVGLPFAVAARPFWPSIVNNVRQALYRPFGLLSLSADSPDFHAHYGSSLTERDHAYHQGMAWPFLLGIYYDAWRRVDARTAQSFVHQVRRWQQLHQHEAGLESISEIIEPHTGLPCGAPFQAWSVAEVHRILEAKRIPTSPLVL